jgi:hypothetical protein
MKFVVFDVVLSVLALSVVMLMINIIIKAM